MTTWACISANSIRDYSFNLPLTALFWRDVIGYRPLCLIYDDWQASLRSRVAYGALKDIGVDVVQVGPVEGYISPNVAQNVREHGACLPDLGEDDWLLTSDADLWPLRKGFYHRHEGTPHKAVCYYANGDHFQGKADVLAKDAAGQRFQTIPTCSVTMKVRTWRELYKYASPDVAVATKATMDWWLTPRLKGKTASEHGFATWMSDQDIVTYKVATADWFPVEALLIDRHGHPPVDRLDRDSWPAGAVDYAKYTDAHVFRAPDQSPNWERLRAVIEYFMPQHLAWADEYRKRHIESYVN